MSKLLVIGSINMDIVSSVQAFPLPGETIHSEGIAFFPGGKGANQAVAAARSGGEVVMVGAVGQDPFGEKLVQSLQENGVNTDLVMHKQGISGLAIITVNEEGENYIVLSEGANGQLTAADVEGAVTDWTDTYAVLLQNEIPWETTVSVMEHADRAGVRVFYNPAPAREIPDSLLPNIHTLILNETEAEIVSGVPVHDAETAKAAARAILHKGTANVIITLGDQGSIFVNAEGAFDIVKAYKVKPIDTTAAGDTFFGAYAAASASGHAPDKALQFAAAAAALAVTKAGAQASIPSKEEIEAFLAKQQ